MLHVNSDNFPSTKERPSDSARWVAKGAVMGLVRIVVAVRIQYVRDFDESEVVNRQWLMAVVFPCA